MSEKEKKRRAAYQKNREKWIFAQSVVIAMLTLAVLISGIVYSQLQKQYYIGYREGGSINYNVFLKENDFYEEEYIGKNQSYVASLIDQIIADFRYEIDMDADDVNYRYSYTINARLEIVDTTSNVAIFKPEYELVNVQNKTQSSSSRLTLNETVLLKYDEYNDLANKFIQTYGLSGVKSNIVVTFEVDVMSSCEAFSGNNVDTYISELRIPLTTKTVNIQMTSAAPGDSESMIACMRGTGSEAFKTTAIVLGIADILAILLLVAFIYLTRTEDITYSARVKKITSQYKSYIQRINNMFDARGYQVIMVNTFDEMLEIHDTIQAPILMYENEDKTCAKFMIPTDSKLLYVYEIKMDGYVEPTPEPEPDLSPTTIVKPNITNVVRPVVKVVVSSPPSQSDPAPQSKPDPEAEITTVMEDVEVSVESESENIAPPEVTATAIVDEIFDDLADELDREIEDILNSIPNADEEPVIEEAPVADEKETPPVPETNTEETIVIRHVEVPNDNYGVELAHNLKKTLVLIRRKAKRIFAAMIAPEEYEIEK